MAVNVGPKPTAAFALSVIAGLVTILAALLLPSTPSLQTLFLINDTSMVTIIQVWGMISGLLIIVGSWLLYSNAAQRKLGSILALVFSLISMNVLGVILGLIGGFLGYTYKTSSTTSSSGRSSSPP